MVFYKSREDKSCYFKGSFQLNDMEVLAAQILEVSRNAKKDQQIFKRMKNRTDEISWG